MNIQVKNNKIHRYEGLWRLNKEIGEKDYDDNNEPYPYPIHKTKKHNLSKFIEKLKIFQLLLTNNKKYAKYKKPKKCLICGKHQITTKLFDLENVHWTNGYLHYIIEHNINPTVEFKKYINSFYINKNEEFIIKNKQSKQKTLLRMSGVLFTKGKRKYIKITENQMTILDALLVSGGYDKKYIDYKNKLRYSEHSGLLDFNNSGLERIIVSGKSRRTETTDPNIFLPQNMIEAFDYEYMFHTHPPTPKPGGRVNEGVLYEFPSISDIFHFIDHYNEGMIQGSIVVAPEGVYIIRSYRIPFDQKIIILDQNKVINDLENKYMELEHDAINKYGNKFTTDFFYSKIAQNKKYIKSFNKSIHKHNLEIAYYPRIKVKKIWKLPTIYLPIAPIEPLNN